MTLNLRPLIPARFLASLLLLLTVPFVVFAAGLPTLPDGGKVESIGAFTGAGASDALKKALEPKGYRVSTADGTVLCDIWLRNGIATGKNESLGVAYKWIGDSALVAVITIPKATTDFRRQPLKAGSYTLRYGIHPQDGNHLGISPIRDFLLLTPVGDDQTPDAKISFEDLNKMSKKASGTNHAAPISLVSTDGITAWPSVIEDENGHLVFAAKVKTASGSESPIAFVVKGVVETGG